MMMLYNDNAREKKSNYTAVISDRQWMFLSTLYAVFV